MVSWLQHDMASATCVRCWMVVWDGGALGPFCESCSEVMAFRYLERFSLLQILTFTQRLCKRPSAFIRFTLRDVTMSTWHAHVRHVSLQTSWASQHLEALLWQLKPGAVCLEIIGNPTRAPKTTTSMNLGRIFKGFQTLRWFHFWILEKLAQISGWMRWNSIAWWQPLQTKVAA